MCALSGLAAPLQSARVRAWELECLGAGAAVGCRCTHVFGSM